ERTGLSTGATTRLIDRLERSGQVRRTPDPADRRRVILEKTPGHALDEALDAAFRPIGQAMERLLAHYPADWMEELLVFVEQMTAALQDATREVHRDAGG